MKTTKGSDWSFKYPATSSDMHAVSDLVRPRPRSHRVRSVGMAAAVAVAFPAASMAPRTVVPSFATSATSVPGTPTGVAAAQAGAGPDVQITWIPSTAGGPETGATAQLYRMASGGGQLVTSLTCVDGCTSLDFRQLTPGATYVAVVWPSNGAGSGKPAASPAVTLADNCPTGACVTVDATSPIGPANRAAQGFLDSLSPSSPDQTDLTQLGATMWRGAPGYVNRSTLDWSTWNVAEAAGAPTTLVLSNIWMQAQPGVTPWSNWSAYSAWVAWMVRVVLASGHNPTYWEPYNEPGGGAGYSPAGWATVTPALLLQQFDVAYQAIKSVLPSAQIIGPSLAFWSDTPQTPTSSYKAFDLFTFLRYAAANDLSLAAVSWHDIADFTGAYPHENTVSPQNLVDEVQATRAYMTTLPALGNPKVFINESEMPEVEGIPGWDVAYLAAVTDADVDSAGLSCWTTVCLEPTLDGLLSAGSLQPMPDYWVRSLYAQMTGQMVTTTSTNDAVTAVASYEASTSSISALIGRGAGCSQDSTCATAWPSAALRPTESVTVTLTVPWTSGTATVALSDVPGQNLAPMTGPTTLPSQTVAVTPSDGTGTGTVTVTIPSFADGDAYWLTVSNDPQNQQATAGAGAAALLPDRLGSRPHVATPTRRELAAPHA